MKIKLMTTDEPVSNTASEYRVILEFETGAIIGLIPSNVELESDEPNKVLELEIPGIDSISITGAVTEVSNYGD